MQHAVFQNIRIDNRFPIDVKIIYDDTQLEQAIAIANELRERNYSVLSFSAQKQQVNRQQSVYIIQLEKDSNQLNYKEKTIPFLDLKEVLDLLVGVKGATQ